MNLLLYIHWNPDPDLFRMGGFGINWYGAMWAIGLLVVDFVGRKMYRQEGLPQDQATIAIVYAVLGGIIGARLAEVFFYNPIHFMVNPWEIPMVWKGGLASHGGIPGAVLGVYLYARRKKRRFSYMALLDKTSILVLSVASLIRLGNLFNSELYGKEATLPWAFIFDKVDQLPRHPVQVYESLVYMGLFLFLYGLFRKYGRQKTGLYSALFLMLTFGIRILLEFFKAADGYLISGIPLSKTQWLGVPCVLVGLVIYILYKKGYYQHSKRATDKSPTSSETAE